MAMPASSSSSTPSRSMMNHSGRLKKKLREGMRGNSELRRYVGWYVARVELSNASSLPDHRVTEFAPRGEFAHNGYDDCEAAPTEVLPVRCGRGGVSYRAWNRC